MNMHRARLSKMLTDLEIERLTYENREYRARPVDLLGYDAEEFHHDGCMDPESHPSDFIPIEELTESDLPAEWIVQPEEMEAKYGFSEADDHIDDDRWDYEFWGADADVALALHQYGSRDPDESHTMNEVPLHRAWNKPVDVIDAPGRVGSRRAVRVEYKTLDALPRQQHRSFGYERRNSRTRSKRDARQTA